MTAKQEVIHLRPPGWESDPEEERFKILTLDYLTACTYNNYALFFQLGDDHESKTKVVSILQAGLERTLSQARHLCGTIEKDPSGGHSFVKKKDSTVRLFVQWLDSPQDGYPSFADLQNANFCGPALGNLSLWSVHPMTYGEKPEAHIDTSPVVSAFRANFPARHRHVMDCVTEGVIVVYPLHSRAAESNDGPEFTIAYEQTLALDLINDPEWNQYFEYRGVDAVTAGQSLSLGNISN